MLRVVWYELVVPLVCSIPWLVVLTFFIEAIDRARMLEALVYLGVGLWLFAWGHRTAKAWQRWGGYP